MGLVGGGGRATGNRPGLQSVLRPQVDNLAQPVRDGGQRGLLGPGRLQDVARIAADAVEPHAGGAIDQLSQLEGGGRRLNSSAAQPDVDVDQQADRRTHATSGGRQHLGRFQRVDGHPHGAMPGELGQPGGRFAADGRVGDEQIVGHGGQHFGFADLGDRQSDGPGGDLSGPKYFRFVRFGMGPQVEVMFFGVVGHPLQISLDGWIIDHQCRRGKWFHAVIKRANRFRFNRKAVWCASRRGGRGPGHLPMQNRLKMRSSTSSVVTAPLTLPSSSKARRTSAAINSSPSC